MTDTTMEVRHAPSPESVTRMTTRELRQQLLLEHLFEPGRIRLVYWHVDRAVVGSAVPTAGALRLDAGGRELAAEYFAQRRELGVINLGDAGSVRVDGKEYAMAQQDALYIGRGSREIDFSSRDGRQPARFYLVSYPAHASHPTAHARCDQAEPVKVGTPVQANQRTIHKYIHPAGIKSCQLVMGFTRLAEGSVWNTMPCHTHPRRSEVYMYFDMGPQDMVFHLMGRPDETRHLIVRDGQAVLAPSWSIHSGCGTSAYSFVWAMGGENQDFNDMDGVETGELA